MRADDTAAIKRQVRNHLRVFWILLTIVGINVALSALPMDRIVRNTLHIGLAVVCAGLVLTIYMHLLSEAFSTIAILGCTAVLFAALVALTLVANRSHPDLTETHTGASVAQPAQHHVP